MLTSPLEALRELFGFMDRPNLAPRYNIAPTQQVATVRLQWDTEREEEARRLAVVRWGLVPSWAKAIPGSPGNADAPLMINARAESVATKPSFRTAFKRRRCLIPADGFYEWRKPDKDRGETRKQPYRIGIDDWAPFAFAGLWERWEPKNGEASANGTTGVIESCTIITTTANRRLAPVHDRMPVIVEPADYGAWLATDTDPEHLTNLLRPFPPDRMQLHPVDNRVGSPRHDDAELIAPITLEEPPPPPVAKPAPAPPKSSDPQGSLF